MLHENTEWFTDHIIFVEGSCLHKLNVLKLTQLFNCF